MITHKLKLRLVSKNTLNRILTEHWGRRKEEKDLYYLVVKEALQKQGTVDIVNYPIVVKYHFFTTGRQLDWTNLAGMTKLIEDTLVQAGVFKDDSPRYIRSGTLLSDKLPTKKGEIVRQYVEVTIYEPEGDEVLSIEPIG